ncbi:hypothetical protein MKZ38_001133 [Zalerion maritima]|uniref:BTB domain-containing protein n=1 Tax=Zalerion maritima TaxID=339359 RepID=A0AAD5WTF7_9PEZI|nr:hypothetical protein MKZ38_001133 [Zalerion maritima]
MPRLGTHQSNKATSLFNDPKFGDCKVICNDGREFYCSKWKLAEQSEFFYKSLSGAWKESNASTIELEEEDSAPIEAMLYYLHTNQYTFPNATAPGIKEHVSIFATADFYCVDSLKSKAREFFEQQFPRQAVGEMWFEVVEQVYTTTFCREGGLGEIVIKTALQRMGQLTEYEGKTGTGEKGEKGDKWLELCLRYPDVLRDLFKKLRAGVPTGTGANGVGGGGGGDVGGEQGSVPISGMGGTAWGGPNDHFGGRRLGGGSRLGGQGNTLGGGGGGPRQVMDDSDDD